MEFYSSTPSPEKPVVPPPSFGAPSHKQQSWGALISIVIIVLMVVLGAFYAWGERIANDRAYTTPSNSTTTH